MAVAFFFNDGSNVQIAAAASIVSPSYLGAAWVDMSTALPGASGGSVVGSVELSTIKYVTYQN